MTARPQIATVPVVPSVARMAPAADAGVNSVSRLDPVGSRRSGWGSGSVTFHQNCRRAFSRRSSQAGASPDCLFALTGILTCC